MRYCVQVDYVSKLFKFLKYFYEISVANDCLSFTENIVLLLFVILFVIVLVSRDIHISRSENQLRLIQNDIHTMPINSLLTAGNKQFLNFEPVKG